MRRGAGRAALAARDGQRAAKVAPVPAPRGEAGLTAGAGQEVLGLGRCYRVEGGGSIQKHLGDAAGKSPSWRCGSRRAPLPRRPPSFPPRLLLPSIPASILRQVLAHVTGA